MNKRCIQKHFIKDAQCRGSGGLQNSFYIGPLGFYVRKMVVKYQENITVSEGKRVNDILEKS